MRVNRPPNTCCSLSNHSLPSLYPPSPVYPTPYSRHSFYLPSFDHPTNQIRPPQPPKPASTMGRAQSEIAIIMGTLSSIYTIMINTRRGILLKPDISSPTWRTIVRDMHRLLVLRGLISEGDRFPEDPWELFLREFGASGYQTQSYLVPSSILITSPRFGGLSSQQSQQQQNRDQGSGQSQGAGSGRRIRFQLPE